MPSGMPAVGKPIPLDALPEPIAEKAQRAANIHTLGRTLGKWLGNRKGRWVGEYSVVSRGYRGRDTLWQVRRYAQDPGAQLR